MSRTTIGARPRLISSHSSKRGFDISARPMRGHLLLAAGQRGARQAGAAGQHRKQFVDAIAESTAPGRPIWPPISRFSSTVSEGNSRRPSGTSAMPRATTAKAGMPPIGSPSKHDVVAAGRD